MKIRKDDIEEIKILGEKGVDAVVDYDKIKQEVINDIPIPKDGKDGRDGKNGKDGKSPTKKELVSLIKPLIPEPPTDADIIRLIEPLVPDPIIPDTIEEIIEKINKSENLLIKSEKVEGYKNYDDEIATLQNRTQLLLQISTQRSNSAGGSALEVLNSGSSLDAAVTSINFNTGLTASNVGHAITVNNNLLVGISGGQKIISGTGVGDKLQYQNTTANGTPGAVAHEWLGGNNGALVLGQVTNSGNWLFGATSTTLPSKFEIVGGLLAVRTASGANSAEFYLVNDANTLNRSFTGGYGGTSTGTRYTNGFSGEHAWLGNVGNFPFEFITNGTYRGSLLGNGNWIFGNTQTGGNVVNIFGSSTTTSGLRLLRLTSTNWLRTDANGDVVGGSSPVTSINTLKNDVTLSSGEGITITDEGSNVLKITASTQGAVVEAQFDKTDDSLTDIITDGASARLAVEVFGGYYDFEAKLFVQADGGSGSQFAVGAESSSVDWIYYEVTVLDQTNTAIPYSTTHYATTNYESVPDNTGLEAQWVVIKGTAKVSGHENLTVKFAQATGGGGTSSVLQGSTFVVRKI